MALVATQFRCVDMFAQITDYTARNDTTTYIYAYRTTDAAATVEAAGYFDGLNTAQNVRPPQRGDVLWAVMANSVGVTPVLKAYVFTTAISYGDAHNGVTLQTTTAG